MYTDLIKDINKAHMEIVWANDSITAFKGSDNAETLRGETLMGATLDECATMKDNVWPEIVRPMLTVNHGWCDFIGTPKGKNWFFDLYNHATKEEWRRYQAASNESPFFSDDEFEEVRRTTPERIFRQEYLAEFLESDSEVFRGILDCVKGKLEKPKPESHYIMGVDLAKSYDWTVITVWDLERKHLVAYDRFNQIEWPLQEKRIVNLAERYKAKVIVDATGVGDPVYDNLKRKGIWVEPVKFTNLIKAHLIENLSMLIEKREITYPHLPELVAELQTFELEKLPSGTIRYNAPSGYHDDIVISMALAAREFTKGRIKRGEMAWL